MTTETKKPRTRWRREKAATGLMAVGAPVRGWDLLRGDGWLAHVRPLGRDAERGWYWYGMDNNTAYAPVATPEEAKQQAEARLREVEASGVVLEPRR